MVSSEELESYSSEEIEQESDVEQKQPTNTENDAAIAAILDENERLEEQEETASSKRTSSGKQKAAKVTAVQTVVKSPNTADLVKSIRMLQKQVDTLQKQPAKRKIDVSNDAAYDHDVQCSSGITPKKLKLLKVKQLSSASNKLSPMKTSQQLSTAKTKQLSPAKKPIADEIDSSEEEIELHPTNDNDPLAQEVNDENDGDESSEDDEQDDDNIFDDIVGAINIGGDDELLCGEPLRKSWADKLNTAWKTKMPKTSLTTIQQKYKTPNNLTSFRVPKMNKDIWDLCTKWHKKADLNMSASQRALVKAATAVLKLNDYLSNQERSVRHVGAQTTADIVSLLGKVNRELSLRRKHATRSVLKGDYKKLASSTADITENLFGDNITQDIKDINTKRRIGEQSRSRGYGYYNNYRGGGYNRGGYRGSNNNNNYDNSFLWNRRGWGRQHQASHTTTTYNNQHQKKN